MEFSGEYVCLRLTDEYVPDDIWDIIINDHVDYSRSYMVVHEVGEETEKPHSHSLLPLNKSINSFRNWLKRQGIDGNEKYSMKKASEKINEMFDYMCKGLGTGQLDKPDVTHRSPDIDDEMITTANMRYWAVNAALREGKRKKRRRDEPAGVQILEICKNKGAPVFEDEIIDYTLKWYAENKYSMNAMQMKAVVTWVSYCLNDESNRIEMLRNELKFKC